MLFDLVFVEECVCFVCDLLGDAVSCACLLFVFVCVVCVNVFMWCVCY